MTVGVNTEGDDLPGELAYIASNPTWVFNVDGFADLAPIIEDVSTVTCEQAIGPAVPLGNGCMHLLILIVIIVNSFCMLN